jgi:hypothetical protein
MSGSFVRRRVQLLFLASTLAGWGFLLVHGLK